jgi:hypothetical protein
MSSEKQTYHRTSPGFYENETGDRLEIKSVNRQYGTVKKPVYFLSRHNPTTKKAEYISGMFSTKQPLVFSFDTRDALGIKTIKLCTFSENGDSITLEPKPEKQRGAAA